MARLRRFHLDYPPISVWAGAWRVSFVGATFHARSVMIEYDVVPPFDRNRTSPFGPALLRLVVTDDVDPQPYDTSWEDFDWALSRPGRMTTRLQRRPPVTASVLQVSVRELGSDTVLADFDIGLPPDHAAELRATTG